MRSDCKLAAHLPVETSTLHCSGAPQGRRRLAAKRAGPCPPRGARRYEALEDSLRGEMHEVCPKFLAFKGPLRPGHPARLDGEVAFPAEHYARLFRDMGVRAVVHPHPLYTPSDWFRPQNPPTVTTSLPVPAKATSSSPNLLPRQRAGTRGGQSPHPVPEMRPPDTAAGTPQKPAALTRRCGCGGRRVAPRPPHKAVPALRPSCAALTGAIGTRPLLIEAGALSTGPRRTAGKVLRRGS